MAWSPDELQVISDRWRVSTLIRAAVELSVALCILLCAIISSAATRLLKASRPFPCCVLCEVNHQRNTQGGAQCCLPICDGLQVDGLHPSSRSNSINRDNLAMGTNCENSVSECTCESKVVCILDKTSSAITNSMDSGTNRQDGSHDSLVQNERKTCPTHRGRSSETVSVAESDRIDRVKTENASVFYACKCRRLSEPAYQFVGSFDRTLKRKFAKVFPNDGSCRSDDPSQGWAERHCVESEGGHEAETTETIVSSVRSKGLQTSSSFREDSASDREESWKINYGGRFASKDYLDDSTKENDRCSRRILQNSSRAVDGLNFRKRENRSISSDLAVGQTSSKGNRNRPPLWIDLTEMEGNIPLADPVKESCMQEADPESLISQLKEALQAHREALHTLYTELEEERSASSSAAHEAMAMISRLQDEKASVQMEARQYQRMAEEKQSYDQEAIAVLQEILFRRDEELYMLEDELNFHRERLANLSSGLLIEGNNAHRLEPHGRVNDMFLMERKTLALEGREEWKNEILTEIKDWLHAAKENAVPKLEQGLDLPVNNLRICNEVDSLPLHESRKNLLELFSSASEEESLMNALAIEAAKPDAKSDAGYESFQCTMESMRQELSSQGGESLETLQEREQKFQTQRLMETARNGDELREICENTVSSLERDKAEIAELRSRLRSSAERPMITESTLDNFEFLDQDEVEVDTSRTKEEKRLSNDEVDISRTMEEKRLSVLEYVWRFEEQLHQHGKEKPFPSGKSVPSTVFQFGTAEPSNSAFLVQEPKEAKEVAGEAGLSLTHTSNASRASTRARKRTLSKQQSRKSAEAPNSNIFGKNNSLAGEGGLAGKEKVSLAGPNMSSSSDELIGHQLSKEHPCDAGFSLVHDVHEVRPNIQDSFHEKRDFASLENQVVRGEITNFEKTINRVEDVMNDGCDRLGKPDFISVDKSVDFSNDGTGLKVVNNPLILNLSHTEQLTGEEEGCKPRFNLNQKSLPALTVGTFCASPSLHTEVLGMKVEDFFQKLMFKFKSLETDRQVMEHTINCLRKENGEMRLVQKISKQPTKASSELEISAAEIPDSSSSLSSSNESSIKGMVPLNGTRFSLQTQLSKLAHFLLGSSSVADGVGNQNTALCQLFQKSPRLINEKPLQRASSFNVTCSSCAGESSVSSQGILLVSQQSWPVTVRERSETALSGWDY